MKAHAVQMLAIILIALAFKLMSKGWTLEWRDGASLLVFLVALYLLDVWKAMP